MGATMWMVRAGESGFRFEEFEKQGIASIGWHELGDLTTAKTRDEVLAAVRTAFPAAKKGTIASYAGQVYRFVREIKIGDSIVSYDPSERVYLVGKVTGNYEYRPQASAEHPNIRSVNWQGRVYRDALSVAARNSLGAIATLFTLPPDVAREIEEHAEHTASASKAPLPVTNAEVIVADGDVAQVDDLYRDIQSKGFEFIKDKVSLLDWEEMQELVAGLLRAMGYKTRISPSGSDRGKDIIASPDGLGFEDPRIVVEVKHRVAAMGSQELRSFLGGRHENDKGLYVSTGGFTKDARYEAERARIPVTLMDLDDLVKSLLEHYDRLDSTTQRLVPLRLVYWPA